MNIGLDYDDTFSADPELWELLIHAAKARGHDVRIVTFRFESTSAYANDDVIEDAKKNGIPVIFCNGIQKDRVTRDLGFPVDIWIDDWPVGIPIAEHLAGMAVGARRDALRYTPPNFVSQETKYSEEPLVIQ